MTIQSDIEKDFEGAILSEDANLGYSLLPGQHLYFMMKALSATIARSAEETQNLFNNIFPSSANSIFLDKHASNLGLPPRRGATASIGVMRLVSTDVSQATYVIPEGITLINIISNVSYETSADVTIPINSLLNTIDIPFISLENGANTYSIKNSLNNFNNPLQITPTQIITQASIYSITPGIDLQSDSEFAYIINKSALYPKGSGSKGDYFNWALQSDATITDAQIIATGEASPANNDFIFVAIMTGSRDPSINVELPYPISRSANSTLIATCDSYIESKRGLNDNVQVLTVSTYALVGNANTYLNVKVILSDGLTLTTSITSNDGRVKTVSEWIKYQLRYAVLATAYQGNIVNNNAYIFNTDLVTLLLNGLGNNNSIRGSIASLLIDVKITYFSPQFPTGTPDVPVPYGSAIYINQTLQIIYDVDVDTFIRLEV